MWHIPNGSITRIGNKSQKWSRALLDVDVAYDTDVDFAGEVIKASFEEALIEIPFPQRDVWDRSADGSVDSHGSDGGDGKAAPAS